MIIRPWACPVAAESRSRRLSQYLANALARDWLDHATLSDQGIDILRWRNVEGRIVDVDATGSGVSTETVGDLRGITLFDRNSVAAG